MVTETDALVPFEGWYHRVPALIAGTEQVFKWAMFDRPSLETWTKGRVALLGDAAHPMMPFMAQGAAQSIEDALALACCLAADRDDPQRAVDTYASCRRDRAAALQAASREQGRDLQSSDPAEVAARNAQMRQSPEAPTARYDWAWGYDVERAIADH